MIYILSTYLLFIPIISKFYLTQKKCLQQPLLWYLRRIDISWMAFLYFSVKRYLHSWTCNFVAIVYGSLINVLSFSQHLRGMFMVIITWNIIKVNITENKIIIALKNNLWYESIFFSLYCDPEWQYWAYRIILGKNEVIKIHF
jgi:hypothetical protein